MTKQQTPTTSNHKISFAAERAFDATRMRIMTLLGFIACILALSSCAVDLEGSEEESDSGEQVESQELEPVANVYLRNQGNNSCLSYESARISIRGCGRANQIWAQENSRLLCNGRPCTRYRAVGLGGSVTGICLHDLNNGRVGLAQCNISSPNQSWFTDQPFQLGGAHWLKSARNFKCLNGEANMVACRNIAYQRWKETQ